MDATRSLKIEDVSLDVELEEVQFSYSFGEARPGRGGAALAGATAQQRIQSAATDFEAMHSIRAVVEAYESLLPSDVKASFGLLTTAPYTSISGGVAETIDGPALDAWIQSPAFAAAISTYSGNQKHNVQLVRFDAVLIDESTASVQYVIRDEVAAGNVQYAASAAVLIKDVDTWRIAVHMQHPL
ncbi:MAG: hypothetical protein HY855_04415 [Burkholderiales bacterium]|nr:hypothetical protein [Burkholderiales bacterium]